VIPFDDPYLLERRQKAETLKAAGIEPYGGAFERSHSLQGARDALGPTATPEPSAATVRLAGRLVAIRGQGKASFCQIQDQSGRMQGYFKQDILGEAVYQGLFKKLDLADFIGIEGPVFVTRTGELSVEVRKLTLLSKALLPPPDKFHGLKDTELKYRQRYLDLMANEETRSAFLVRSQAMAGLRAALQKRGFLEVETPMLQVMAGGAAARPFVTHHNALDLDLFLRIAPELYLKRLLVGGFDKVFELNRNFRNEGLSPRHNPEFTMVEVYEAYADGDAMMRLTEALITELAQAATGGSKVSYQGSEIELAAPYRRLPMRQAVIELGGIADPDSLDDAALAKLLPDMSPAARKALTPGKRLEALFGAHVEEKLVQPTFVTDYPIEISPLAKRKTSDPSLADRFELFIYGREIANGFSELNDPVDQHQRFVDQLNAKASGDEEAHAMDEDFVVALLHGMPPAGGLGLGMDRLIMLLTDAASIRDVILFPHMRPRKGAPEDPSAGSGQAPE
jgi:lysyl-tRNA synthetase class 2